jgi:hypothetical protein
MDSTDLIQNLGNIGDFVGAIGVIATLAYLGVQVRQTRMSNERDAAIELIRSFQTPEFTQMLQKSFELPVGLTRQEFESRYAGDLARLYSYFATWESLGIMVQRRQIDLALVCDFFSHPILHAWRVWEVYVTDLRKDLGRDTPWEWFQWLAEKVAARESAAAPIPAYIEFRDWKE